MWHAKQQKSAICNKNKKKLLQKVNIYQTRIIDKRIHEIWLHINHVQASTR